MSAGFEAEVRLAAAVLVADPGYIATVHESGRPLAEILVEVADDRSQLVRP